MAVTCPESHTMTVGSTETLDYTMIAPCKAGNTKIEFTGDTTITFQLYTLDWTTKEIDFGPGTVTIGDQAFRACHQLQTVTIGPNTRLQLKSNQFASTHNDISFTISPENTYFWLYDQCLYYQDALICVPRRATSITVPSNVTKIAGLAAYECALLEAVALKSPIITWCQHAPFALTTKLRTITGATANGKLLVCGTQIAWASPDLAGHLVVPPNIDYMNYMAFRSCTLLTSVRFQAKSVYIGSLAFSNSGVTSIVFDGAVEFSGDSFAGAKIKTLRFKNTKVANLKSALNNIKTVETIIIPCAGSRTAFADLENYLHPLCTKQFSKKSLVSVYRKVFVRILFAQNMI